MSAARPLPADLLLEPHLFEQLVEILSTMEVPGMTEPTEGLAPAEDLDLLGCLMEDRDQVALRLACIGDEMDLRLRSPRLAQLPGMAMHSLGLAVTYNQTGVRGVFRSLANSLGSLRQIRTWVTPGQVCRQALPAMLLLLLLVLSGVLHLLLK
ncbi:bcl-2-interacting killer [Tupaia chinensis]|uniref:Bcl-2-interacting killer n=1 Tax=Tupaia chinensis TaxID=246437 RepID=L9KP51_TUPCH|nr:bcl-2-interacting killer [Tupaia chinensis]ELW64498.1 Bcl-2-interacting killer [Tupaia chinensis]